MTAPGGFTKLDIEQQRSKSPRGGARPAPTTEAKGGMGPA